MPPEPIADGAAIGHARISDVSGVSERTLAQKLFASQPFWVTVALLVLIARDGRLPAALLHLGQHRQRGAQLRALRHHGARHDAVIITGGIDLSVGSIMGLVAHRRGPAPDLRSIPGISPSRRDCSPASPAAPSTGSSSPTSACPSFVVTLGMLSIARSLAVVVLRQPDALPVRPRRADREGDRPGEIPSGQPDSVFPAWIPALSSHFWVMVILGLLVGYVFNYTAWGRHLFAIGGNEQAARHDRRHRSTGSSSRPTCSRPSPRRSPRC